MLERSGAAGAARGGAGPAAGWGMRGGAAAAPPERCCPRAPLPRTARPHGTCSRPAGHRPLPSPHPSNLHPSAHPHGRGGKGTLLPFRPPPSTDVPLGWISPLPPDPRYPHGLAGPGTWWGRGEGRGCVGALRSVPSPPSSAGPRRAQAPCPVSFSAGVSPGRALHFPAAAREQCEAGPPPAAPASRWRHAPGPPPQLPSPPLPPAPPGARLPP